MLPGNPQRKRCFHFRSLVLAMLFAGCWLTEARAFYSNGRWSQTATQGATGPVGTPVTVTWSIPPDGTFIPVVGRASNLIATFDLLYGGGGATLAQRPWFANFASTFNRWTELSGIQFVYEPADDGVNLGAAAGALGVRGDVRVGGALIDGAGGTLAQTGFLDDVDITIDTSDTAHYGNSATNYSRMRNTLMHEIGHALGLAHLDSNSAAFLMEPLSVNGFDGPQLDDIRGAQQLYGDALDRANNGAGNQSAELATALGSLSPGQSLARGVHSSTGTFVVATETDFLSISNSTDVDWFSFNNPFTSQGTLSVTPVGASYNQRPGSSGAYTTVNAAAQNDLSFQLYRLGIGVPQLVATASSSGVGAAESMGSIGLAAGGTYGVRISGASSSVQLYELRISLTALPGDYTADGVVDAADYTVWRDTLGSSVLLTADGSGNGVIDSADYDLWASAFSVSAPAAVSAVCEPAGLSLVALLAFSGILAQKRGLVCAES